MENVIERVVLTARCRLSEPLTIDDLAKIAMFSKFHFARMFQRVTGVSPGRFLSALRLQEAKRLLVTSSLSVAEVSHQVGYASVGTFTSRFTASVGAPPTVFRKLRGEVPLDVAQEPSGPDTCGVVVTGAVLPHQADGGTFVGLFRQPVLEGRPVRSVVLPRPGRWTFQDVPAGKWYLLAASSLHAHADPTDLPWGEDTTLLGVCGPLDVGAGLPALRVDVRLRPKRLTDPPILLALTDLLASPLCAPPYVEGVSRSRQVGSLMTSRRQLSQLHHRNVGAAA